MENQKFNGESGFDPRYSAVVPLPFLDKLLKCYYGAGPRDGENEFLPQFSKGVEVQGPQAPQVPTEDIDLRETFIKTAMPEGYIPRGAAKRKITEKENKSDQE